jgi:hypothetical protein
MLFKTNAEIRSPFLFLTHLSQNEWIKIVKPVNRIYITSFFSCRLLRSPPATSLGKQQAQQKAASSILSMAAMLSGREEPMRSKRRERGGPFEPLGIATIKYRIL